MIRISVKLLQLNSVDIQLDINMGRSATKEAGGGKSGKRGGDGKKGEEGRRGMIVSSDTIPLSALIRAQDVSVQCGGAALSRPIAVIS